MTATGSARLPIEPKPSPVQRGVVEVPAGAVDCWQVRLRPRLTGMNLMPEKMRGGLLPPAVAHIEAAAPHRMIRFGFPTGPMPWDPRGVMELVS